MKKIISFAFGAALCASAMAQAPQPMKTAERLAMWKDSLNLSDVQMKQLWDIERQYNPEFDTVKFDGIFDEARAREQTRQVKIREVLTDEQNARLSQMQLNERRARRKMMNPNAQPSNN